MLPSERRPWKSFEVMDTPIKRTSGLMFRKNVTKPLLFVFPTEQTIPIHSFFCPHFDVIFLDRRKVVVDFKSDVKPSGTYTAKAPAKYMIEASAGSIKKFKIRKGNLLLF